MLPTHSHSGTEDCLANKVLSLIAMNYLGTMRLESSEDHNKFMDYVREMRVIIKGVSLLFGLFRLVLVNPGIQGFKCIIIVNVVLSEWQTLICFLLSFYSRCFVLWLRFQP